MGPATELQLLPYSGDRSAIAPTGSCRSGPGPGLISKLRKLAEELLVVGQVGDGVSFDFNYCFEYFVLFYFTFDRLPEENGEKFFCSRHAECQWSRGQLQPGPRASPLSLSLSTGAPHAIPKPCSSCEYVVVAHPRGLASCTEGQSPSKERGSREKGSKKD